MQNVLLTVYRHHSRWR